MKRESVRKFFVVYKKNRLAVAGITLFLFINFVGFAAPLLARYPPNKPDAGESFMPPSFQWPMGTDDLGRDIMSEVFWGARTSLTVAYLTILTSTALGVVIGVFAGFYGGWIDQLLMRITEFFFVIPSLVLCIVLVAIFGPNIYNIILALSITSWPLTARLVRSEFLSLREQPFVEAATASGDGNLSIMFREILPNVIPIIVVNATVQIASVILSEAYLGFFGLSDPRVVSWGLMIFRAFPFFRMDFSISFFPAIFIAMTALAFNFVGEGLNDAMNPRIARK
jgi:peptide/nickel transport system permease protein